MTDKEERIYDAVREAGLDWHAGWREDGEPNRYVLLWEKAWQESRKQALAEVLEVLGNHGEDSAVCILGFLGYKDS